MKTQNQVPALQYPPQTQTKLQVKFKDDKPKFSLNVVATYNGDFLESVEGLTTTSLRRKTEEIKATFPVPNRLSDLGKMQSEFPFLEYSICNPDQDKADLNAKIATFRQIWEAKEMGKFVVTKQDRRDWADIYKDIPAIPEQIQFYLATNTYPIKGNKCISDFCRHYNDVIRMMQADKQPKKAEYPDHWDKYVYTELGKKSNDHVLAYARHLVSLGYKKKTDNTGATYYAKEQ